MPKQVMARLVSRIVEDVRANYSVGDWYRTVREVGRVFGVSLQTAHRAVSRLSGLGVLERFPGSGIRVVSLGVPDPTLRGLKVLVVSDNPDPRFNAAFMGGIGDAFGPVGIKAVLRVNDVSDTRSYGFGETVKRWVQETDASGVVSLYFRGSDLPLFFLIAQGIPVVSDIILDALPPLAAVQTDNRTHARKAARIFSERGIRKVLTVGFWDAPNVRHEAFREEFMKGNPDGAVRYLDLKDHRYVGILHAFLRDFEPKCGIFSLDFCANHAIVPQLVAAKIDCRDRFLVYDAEDEIVRVSESVSVPAVAPSLRTLGRRLASKLVVRLATGAWSEPVQERI
jgi:DNA-binding LacI/PurR family transcriptional regulator